MKNPRPAKKNSDEPEKISSKKSYDRDGKTALMKATDLLAYQEQSSKNLKRKLIARKYEEPEVDEAIEKLKQYNYLNDEDACRRQFEIFYKSGKLSVRQICVKLIQRGFDENFVRSLVPENAGEHDLKAAEILLEKKFDRRKFEKLDAKEKLKYRNKIWQQLATRGFDGETVQNAMEKFSLF